MYTLSAFRQPYDWWSYTRPPGSLRVNRIASTIYRTNHYSAMHDSWFRVYSGSHTDSCQGALGHSDLVSILVYMLFHFCICFGRYINNSIVADRKRSQARTDLSPFTRCTLGLKRHFYYNILCDHCLDDTGLYIQKN